MTKISAFIITKNEEKLIAIAINSLKELTDEIILVDSGSTDNTVKIAKDLGAKVYLNEWKGYVEQKSFAEKLCQHDWILNIDADEELSPKLKNEIKELCQSSKLDNSEFYAYKINLVIMHRTDRKIRPFAPSNCVIRFYNRRYCSFANSKINTTHDSVMFNPDINQENKIGTFKNIGYHRSFVSLEQQIAKANFYSSEQAKDMLKNKRIPSRLRIIAELPFFFFKVYFLRRYFIFGFDGFVDSAVCAFRRFIRLAKARELVKLTNSDNQH